MPTPQEIQSTLASLLTLNHIDAPNADSETIDIEQVKAFQCTDFEAQRTVHCAKIKLGTVSFIHELWVQFDSTLTTMIPVVKNTTSEAILSKRVISLVNRRIEAGEIYHKEIEQELQAVMKSGQGRIRHFLEVKGQLLHLLDGIEKVKREMASEPRQQPPAKDDQARTRELEFWTRHESTLQGMIPVVKAIQKVLAAIVQHSQVLRATFNFLINKNGDIIMENQNIRKGAPLVIPRYHKLVMENAVTTWGRLTVLAGKSGPLIKMRQDQVLPF